MHLLKELQKRQTLNQCNRIIKYVGTDKERFSELVNLFFSGEYRITQHAAWPMSYCIRETPALAKPYMKKFIDQLGNPGTPVAAKRNIARLLQYTEVPKRYQGKLMDCCFQFISSPEEAIAVKAFSLTILEHLSASYPEILPELKSVIEARWDFETPAFKSRAKIILTKLKK